MSVLILILILVTGWPITTSGQQQQQQLSCRRVDYRKTATAKATITIAGELQRGLGKCCGEKRGARGAGSGGEQQ